jgi:hypothetical protein
MESAKSTNMVLLYGQTRLSCLDVELWPVLVDPNRRVT